MTERWRTWEPPLRVEPVHQGIWLPDGRTLGEFQLTWSPEQIERFRTGYRCVNCLEPQERAWPERCSLCSYPMRREQAAFFAREFAGEIVLRRRDWDEELAGLEERRRKEDERRQKEGHAQDPHDQLGRQ